MKKYFVQIFTFALLLEGEAQVEPVPIEMNKQGGYIGCLDYEPGMPNHILAAGGRSGLYESVDGGKTWGHIDSLPAYNISFVSFCPSDANVVLLTAGHDTRLERHSGIWRSADKGRTWTNVSIPPAGDPVRCRENTGAHGISWIPNTDAVIIGTDCGVLLSETKGTTWGSISPVNRWGWTLEPLPDTIYSVLAVDENKWVANTVTGTFWTNDRGASWHPAAGIPTNSSGGAGHSFCVTPTDRKILFYYNYGSLPMYSVDFGQSWTGLSGCPYGGNQPPFVKATLSNAGDNHTFDLYLGDGRGLSRLRLDSRDESNWASVRRVELRLGHADPQDILFHPTSRKPFILSGDGGIQLPESEDAASWVNVGGGRDGLNGLEVKGIAAQTMATSGAQQTDLYVATWHNFVFWSSDNGVSWQYSGLTEASNVEGNGPLVSAADARISLHDFDRYLHLYGRGFSAITTPLEPLFRQGVQGVYFHYFIKNGRQCILADVDNTFYLVPVTGGPWKRFYQFTPTSTEPSLLAALSISYPSDGTVVIYQPYLKMANDSLIRLKKIRVGGTIDAPIASVTSVPMNGFGSLGQMWDDYRSKAVFAVKPDNSEFLIAADVVAGKMQKSVDGGRNWTADDGLTDLVTDSGRLQFYTTSPRAVPPLSQAQAIAFNRFNNQEVYVSTVESGIIQSRDGGMSWNRLPGSEGLHFVNSFGFSPDGLVYFGSKARGLWKYNSKFLLKYPFLFVHDPRILITDRMTGAVVPIGDLGPDKCPACLLHILANGEVTDVHDSADGSETAFVSNVDSLYTFGPEGRAAGAPKFTQALKAPSEPIPSISQIKKTGKLVKGLISKDGKILAFIVADETMKDIPPDLLFRNEMSGKPVAVQPEKSEAYKRYHPSVRILGSTSTVAAAVEQGELVTISGAGFEPTKGDTHLVKIGNGSSEINSPVNSKGTFSVQFKIPARAGQQTIYVTQQTKWGSLNERVTANVLNSDK